MTIKRLEHVGVNVSDMARSEAFYNEVFGLIKLEEYSDRVENMHLVFMGFPDESQTAIELVLDPPSASSGPVDHIAFTVDDIESEYVRIRGLGVPCIHPSVQRLANGMRYAFFTGPDGESLELFQRA